VRSIEEILRRTIGEQIELIIHLEPDLAMVVADPGHIEQIISIWRSTPRRDANGGHPDDRHVIARDR